MVYGQFHDCDAGSTIILDVGSSSVKAGFCGEDLPRAVFPARVGDKPTHKKRSARGMPESAEATPATRRDFPVRDGAVADWDLLGKLLELTFTEELETTPEQGYAVLVAEAPGAKEEQRERMARLLFETMKAPAVCFYNAAALSLFASGRTRGLVLDVGASVSKAVPVFEGFGIAHALTTSKRAGAAVTAVLAEKMGLGHDDARHAKEKACAFGAPEDVEVELPDGTVVSVDAAARALAPEALFEDREVGEVDEDCTSLTRPGDDDRNLQTLVASSLQLCDKDLQVEFAENVVLAGGTTMLPGFCGRLQNELERGLSHRARCVPGGAGGPAERGYTKQRKHAAWVGGSLFASLETFEHIKVTKREWEDDEEAVHKRSF